MKTFKIFLAVIMIMLASNLLSGCSTTELSSAELSRLSMARIETARELKKAVQVTLEEVSDSKELVLNLTLQNPENKPLSSAEMWLSYNPEKLQGISFEPNLSAFEMMAPYENGFDSTLGLFKFGRSTINPVSDSSVVLGQLHFKKLTNESVFIDAYDYKFDLAGHNSVNLMNEGEPVNILIKPVSPLFAK